MLRNSEKNSENFEDIIEVFEEIVRKFWNKFLVVMNTQRAQF